MRYSNIIEARFIKRPNRFVAVVESGGREETVHVKNTGRCKELLIPGATVYLTKCKSPKRKTAYDLVAVVKSTDRGDILVNMDSQLPNGAAKEWLEKHGGFSKDAVIRPEVVYKNSRFDFCVTDKEKLTYVEVKGVTLESNGVASFPDAPTQRGAKHLGELCDCVENGFGAMIIFVIQMKGPHLFVPNVKTDPQFAAALKKARDGGVRILALDCKVTPDSVICDSYVKTEVLDV